MHNTFHSRFRPTFSSHRKKVILLAHGSDEFLLCMMNSRSIAVQVKLHTSTFYVDSFNAIFISESLLQNVDADSLINFWDYTF